MQVNKNMPILIVNDYLTMRRIVRNLLKQIGFKNVDEANTASVALTKLRATEYSLVIADWNMYPISGINLTKMIRARENEVGADFIPIIVTHANTSHECSQVAVDAGVSDLLCKPFNAGMLENKLVSIFGELTL